MEQQNSKNQGNMGINLEYVSGIFLILAGAIVGFFNTQNILLLFGSFAMIIGVIMFTIGRVIIRLRKLEIAILNSQKVQDVDSMKVVKRPFNLGGE